jgi:7-cyano-7-deazaguanine synthase
VQKKAVIIISGGMDSSLCGYIAKNSGYELIALHFSYGQLTEKRELKSFRDITKSLDVLKTFELDISFIKKIGGSALTDKDLDVPITGIEQGVPITYVPYRNGIFLSIATAVAEQENAEAIYIGVVYVRQYYIYKPVLICLFVNN